MTDGEILDALMVFEKITIDKDSGGFSIATPFADVYGKTLRDAVRELYVVVDVNAESWERAKSILAPIPIK